MRTVGPTDAQLDAPSHSGNWLMQIESPDASKVYRYTNATRDLTWDGNTWQQLNFYPGEMVIDTGGKSAVEVIVEDVDRVIMSVILANDMIDWVVYIWDAWLDENFTVTATTLELEGVIDQGDYDPTSPTNQIALNFIGSVMEQQMMPGEKFTRTCRYRRFKGERCGYTGTATTCNRTFARCTELLNRMRYGGFRFMPEVGTKITIGNASTEVPDRSKVMPDSGGGSVTWGEW